MAVRLQIGSIMQTVYPLQYPPLRGVSRGLLGGLLGAIALTALTTFPAEAQRVRLNLNSSFSSQNVLQTRLSVKNPIGRTFQAPSGTLAPGAEPTCYVQMPGRSVKFLDHLCGVNDPQSDRRRSPHELDKDGLPFVMKENFQAVKDLQKRLQAAQQRMETEMPFSNNAKRLMAEQKNLIRQYGMAKSSAENQAIQRRLQEISKGLQADPSVQKSYEMMGKLYQRNR